MVVLLSFVTGFFVLIVIGLGMQTSQLTKATNELTGIVKTHTEVLSKHHQAIQYLLDISENKKVLDNYFSIIKGEA